MRSRSTSTGRRGPNSSSAISGSWRSSTRITGGAMRRCSRLISPPIRMRPSALADSSSCSSRLNWRSLMICPSCFELRASEPRWSYGIQPFE